MFMSEVSASTVSMSGRGCVAFRGGRKRKTWSWHWFSLVYDRWSFFCRGLGGGRKRSHWNARKGEGGGGEKPNQYLGNGWPTFIHFNPGHLPSISSQGWSNWFLLILLCRRQSNSESKISRCWAQDTCCQIPDTLILYHYELWVMVLSHVMM